MAGTLFKLSPLFQRQGSLGAKFADIAGWRIPEEFSDSKTEKRIAGEAVVLVDETSNGKLTVEGKDAVSVLGRLLEVEQTGIGEGVAISEGMVYRLRPDHYFISTSPGMDSDISKKLEDPGSQSVTVTNMTHGWSEIRILGAVSAELMAKVCGLDLREDVFPVGTARQTSVAKTNQLVLRSQLGGLPSFSLLGARSLAAYLWDVLMEAGEEWGAVPAGSRAVRELGDRND